MNARTKVDLVFDRFHAPDCSDHKGIRGDESLRAKLSTLALSGPKFLGIDTIVNLRHPIRFDTDRYRLATAPDLSLTAV